MTSFRERFQEKTESYIIMGILGIVGPLMLLGFYAHMDSRHEPAGAVQSAVIQLDTSATKRELNTVRRQIRSLENYQRLAPSEQYNAARAAQIAELKDDEKMLEEELAK